MQQRQGFKAFSTCAADVMLTKLSMIQLLGNFVVLRQLPVQKLAVWCSASFALHQLSLQKLALWRFPCSHTSSSRAL